MDRQTTHFQQLEAMPKASGTEYELTQHYNGRHPEAAFAVEVQNTKAAGGGTARVIGHNGFASVWLFRADGSLVATGAGE